MEENSSHPPIWASLSRERRVTQESENLIRVDGDVVLGRGMNPEEEDSGEVEIIYHIVGVRCEGDECLFCREIHIRDKNQESEGSQTHTEVRQI